LNYSFIFYQLCPCCFAQNDILVSDFNLLSYALDEGKKLGVRK
jgi:hypothetical protein